MEQIIKDIEILALEMERKGYDNMYIFGSENIGKMRDGMKEYLNILSPDQRESKLHNGISLQCYVLWNGEDQPNMRAFIVLTHRAEGFFVNSIDLTYTDENYNLLSTLKLENLTIEKLPVKSDLVNAVKNEWEKKIKVKQHIKRRL